MEQPIADLDQAVSVFITTYFDVMADDGEAFNATVAALKAYPEYAGISREVQDFSARSCNVHCSAGCRIISDPGMDFCDDFRCNRVTVPDDVC